MLEKLKKNIDKGIVSVSVKSSAYLEGEKLKAKISNIREEMEDSLKQMGEQVYRTWKEKQVIDEAYITEVCQRVLGKEEEAEGYMAQKEQLEAEKERILKRPGRLESLQAEQGCICSCGNVNEAGAKFCRFCGKKLEKAEEELRTCPQCGSPLEKEAKFCVQCGAAVGIEGQQP